MPTPLATPLESQHSTLPHPMRYALTLSLTLALCFAAQSLALHLSGGKTNKCESNFFSSIARIQTGIRDQPEIMLLGSSLTGRLPDRTQGFKGVSNLGCDGASAVDTLRAMDCHILPSAPILIIEGNTFYRSLSTPTSEIATAIDSPWFRVGQKIHNFGATARPSAFVYSRLLAKKIGTPPAMAGSLLPVATQAQVILEHRTTPSNAGSLIKELRHIVNRLQSRGARIIIVILPEGSRQNHQKIGIPYELARITKIPLLDLTKDLPPNAVEYTDDSHMSPTSAASALRTILKSLSESLSEK